MVSNRTTEPIVQAVGLTKIFRDFWMRQKALAVSNLDMEILPNEIFGLLGPNGSGKSTTIKMILGLLHKTRGRLTVFGKAPSDVITKKRIGFLPEESYLYRYLNPRETLDYYGKLFGLERGIRRRRTDELLEMVGLTQVAHRPIGEFSKGMTRRIGLAQALINDPDLLILDEPTSGLDPIGTRQVKDLILDLRQRRKTILLSSHLLADVEDVCDRMVILYGGKIRAQGTAEDLLQDTERTVITTPRLSARTLERIGSVIREEEHAEITEDAAPRQKLEQLFLEIVDTARREQVATSGAQHGGETAEFLRTGDEEARGEGDELIDALVRDEPAEPARSVEAAPASGESAEDRRDEVIESLLRPEAGTGDEPPRSVQDPRGGQSADRPPEQDRAEVDDSVIDSLLGDGEDEDDRRRSGDDR